MSIFTHTNPIYSAIFSLTMKDSHDRLYYRVSTFHPWVRLDGPNYLNAYQVLNWHIDRLRPKSPLVPGS